MNELLYTYKKEYAGDHMDGHALYNLTMINHNQDVPEQYRITVFEELDENELFKYSVLNQEVL